jgi:hypothetical protein
MHILERAGAAVQDQDRLSAAVGLVPDADAVDIGILAAMRFVGD